MRSLAVGVVLLVAASCLDTVLPPPPGPGNITGRVLVATPGEPIGSPVSGATVRLVESGVSVLSDDDGRFSIGPIFEKQGTLEISSGALKRLLSLQSIGASFGRSIELGDVALSRNASAQGEVQLSGGGEASGTLVFLEGQPNYGYTSQSGQFLLRDLPVGPVTLGVFREGYGSLRVPLELRSGERAFVDAFVLEPEPPATAVVSGRAVLAGSDDASGITVSIGAQEINVDTAGAWQFPSLSPGVYSFAFRAEGRTTVVLANRLVAAGNVELPLVTLAAGTSTTPVIEPIPTYDGGTGGGSGATGGGDGTIGGGSAQGGGAPTGGGTATGGGDGMTGGGAATGGGSGVSGTVVTQVSAGLAHTCAVLDDARAFCWGRDTFGQVSGPPGADSIAPVQVAIDVKQISAGGTHTCVVHNDAGVECWGLNSDRQLGVATPVGNQRGYPTMPARSVSTGASFTCVVSGSQVYCWGLNSSYQCGNGSASSPIAPDTMGNVTIAEAVANGDAHACVLMTVTGTPSVKCSGSPFSGGTQAGNVVLADVRQLASGGLHTCAAKLDGSVWCWGNSNTAGQLGGSGGMTPTAVTGETNVNAVAAGGQHSCALHADGTLHCWGANTSGQLGNGTYDGGVARVTTDIDGVTSIAAGGSHTCAIRDGGTLWCWGNNGYGQLGIDAGLNATLPLRVTLTP